VEIEVKNEDGEYLLNQWTKSRRIQDLGSCTRLEPVCNLATIEARPGAMGP